jgi:Domain of unknown function (DUF397)
VIANSWRKSSYSGYNNNCVEVDQHNDKIRDSKNLTVLPLSRSAVAGLVRAVKDTARPTV